MNATATDIPHAERLARITGLAGSIRSRAAEIDDCAVFPAETFADLRAAGLLALTAPVELGGAGLWSAGRYRPFWELIGPLARIDSVIAQLLQVHSHMLGIVAGLAGDEQRQAPIGSIVADGRLLASVGSEAKPSGKLADVSRAELAPLPGAGPYAWRGVRVLELAAPPEVE
ncbi:MAG: acyl-CoA dehydrogenase family protein, partial [Streptosporangiaceae bacterium]